MENSKIEWTDHTFNPWLGCQKISPGCDHCYAESWAKRFQQVEWGPHAERKKTSKQNWAKPLKWAAEARETGRRPKVFCASMADVFDNKVPPEWRAELFELIKLTPELDWLLLSKRPKNMRKMLSRVPGWPFPNVWLDVTCESQDMFDRRWPIVANMPAAVRFISYEPALTPLSLPENGLLPDWVICGGETGANARVMKQKWARELLRQCADLRVAFFMKQMTNKATIPADLLVREYPAL